MHVWKDPKLAKALRSSVLVGILRSLLSLLQLIHFSSFQQEQLSPLTQPIQKVLIWKFGQGRSSSGMHIGDCSVLSVVLLPSAQKPNRKAQSPRLLKFLFTIGLRQLC